MRRALPALTASVLGVALLSVATPVSAAPLQPPEYVSNTFDPSPVVFTEDIGMQVHGTLKLQEAENGPPIIGADVYDPACDPLDYDVDPGDRCGGAWLHMTIADKIGSINTVTMKGEIPRRDLNGLFVESPTLDVLLTYQTSGGATTYEHADPHLEIYGASRISFDPPAVVEPGASFSVTSKAEHMTDDWYAAKGYSVTLQRSLGGGSWEDQDTGTTDAQGDVGLTSSPVTAAGDWRVRLDDIESAVVTYSTTEHVALPAPVVTPAPTPTPTPAPPPIVTPVPQPPTVSPATHPSAPRRQHTTAASGRATLYWAGPASTGGAAVDRYQIRRGTSSFARNLGPTARRFTFTRLRNGSFYRLYVRAHNAKGFSGWVSAGARPHAPPAPRDYAGCARLHRVYPHGVGRPGAVDRGGHVTDFTRSLATYRLNTEDDRDHDGIACER
jgi:hypothetical protein